jgi:anti-sigma regulatory factor (Ser/Thr protein kinase)
MGAMLVRHSAASVAAVRRSIAADLADNGVDEDSVHDVTLVASELVGNAVRHTELAPDEELGISWTLTPTEVVVSVADGSDAGGRVPHKHCPHHSSPLGRS